MRAAAPSLPERRPWRELALSALDGADLDPLLLLLAVAGGREQLRPRERQPDRPADLAGGHRGQRHVRPDHRLHAERAAHEPGQHPHVRELQAE